MITTDLQRVQIQSIVENQLPAFVQSDFPLLGDYNSKTIQDYDILMKDLLHLKDYNAAKRSVFIIMEDGKIGYKWVSEDPLKEPNYEEIKNFLK